MTNYNQANNSNRKMMSGSEMLMALILGVFAIFLIGQEIADSLQIPTFAGVTIIGFISYFICLRF